MTRPRAAVAGRSVQSTSNHASSVPLPLHLLLTDQSPQTSVQHLLVLIDGNQSFFKSNFIRAGTIGAREAAAAFITEVKEFAKAQHKNDLPENISLVVHIFSDIGRLAQDLSAAGILPDPDQLWTFIQDICKLEPCFTVSDCGSGREAVDAKLKCRALSVTFGCF